ncbi:hypothetical protein [Viscerimonas tarda]
MKVRIGKLLPNGNVRHIDLLNVEKPEKTAFTLKNFYSVEKRLDALLDLGNLNRLNSSPYGKYRWYGDKVHCHAAIRDDNGSRKRNEAMITARREIFTNPVELCFLYENGNWTILFGKRSENIDFAQVLNVIKWKPFFNLEIYEFEKDNRFAKNHIAFADWKELEEYAERENKPVYVFRNNRLATTINHPLTKKQTA